MPKTIEAALLIVSTIAGLGVFILPYALGLSGIFFWFWFIFLMLVIYLLHLAYGEIIFRIRQKHNLPGLVSEFFGSKFKLPVWLFDFVGIQLVFLAYLIAAAAFVSIIFPINPSFIKLAFFLIVALITYFSLNPFAKIEAILSLLLITLFFVVSFYLLPHLNFQNLLESLKFLNFETLKFSQPFFSYGILIFALTGYSSIPIVYDLIGKDKKLFRKINFWALAIIFVLYGLYAISVYGALGSNVSEESLTSLSKILPPALIVLAILLALINILTTFVALVFYLQRGLINDFTIKTKTSWALTNLPVLFFSLLPLEKIAALASLIGSLFISVNLLFLLLCYQKIKKTEYFIISKPIVWLLIVIFGLGWLTGLVIK
jgi:amino acid permease